jgi:hypothetical protein
MGEASGKKLNLPPFPPLRWDEFFWTGRIALPSWRGFQSRSGAYASRSSAKASEGIVHLSVRPPGGVAEAPPSPEQTSALRYLVEHEEAIRDSVVAAILEAYPGMRENVLGDGIVEESEMPEVETAEQLRPLIGLSTVHVLDVVNDGAAYVGFELGCTWDGEHGLGLMTHRGRIIELPHIGLRKVNQADIATEDWVAEEDIKPTLGL